MLCMQEDIFDKDLLLCDVISDNLGQEGDIRASAAEACVPLGQHPVSVSLTRKYYDGRTAGVRNSGGVARSVAPEALQEEDQWPPKERYCKAHSFGTKTILAET